MVEDVILSEKKLIVGLGNPGEQYRRTRHNLGFLVVEEVVRRQALRLEAKEWCQAQIAEGMEAGVGYVLLKPMTFMNHSGTAVKKFLARRGLPPEQMLVVCDDLNLEFGQLRIKTQGSDGGHNGLTSIIEMLGTKDFPRLRLGIGKPRDPQETVDYVLGRFPSAQEKDLGAFVERAADCCFAWVNQDMNQVMSQFNKRNENG